MINTIIEFFKKVDKLTYKIMKNGLVFCLTLSIISALALIIYGLSAITPNLFHISFLLLKLSCTLSVEFIVCGLVMDTVKKQII